MGLVVFSVRQSAQAAGEIGARGALRGGERERATVRGLGLLGPAGADEQLGAGGVEEVEAVELRAAGADGVGVREAGERPLAIFARS